MAIFFYTQSPAALLREFKKAIDNKHVVTWEYDSDGDFTHTTTSEQWNKMAWLRPAVEDGKLALYLLGKQNVKMSKVVYGVYHGRFIESMLTHCDTMFFKAEATAVKTGRDQF